MIQNKKQNKTKIQTIPSASFDTFTYSQNWSIIQTFKTSILRRLKKFTALFVPIRRLKRYQKTRYLMSSQCFFLIVYAS